MFGWFINLCCVFATWVCGIGCLITRRQGVKSLIPVKIADTIERLSQTELMSVNSLRRIGYGGRRIIKQPVSGKWVGELTPRILEALAVVH
jgi:hypothetical protein